MNKSHRISVDDLYQHTFNTHEAEFNSTDWDDMLSRLDSNKTPILLPLPKHFFTNLKHNLIMILFTTIASGIIWFASPSSEVLQTNLTETGARTQTTKSAYRQSDKTEEYTNIKPSLTQYQEPYKTEVKQSTNEELTSNKKAVGRVSLVLDEISEVVSEESTQTDLSQIVTNNPDTARIWKTITSRTWQDTTWKYITEKPSRDIEEGWIGIYLTNQLMHEAFNWERIGRLSETYGFNLQFMSGNVLPGENLAIYGGLDWGMQFYGRSDNSEVLINSVNEDRGLTFLRSHSNDIFISSQMEWAQYPVVPYFTASLGSRILTTGQTTRTLVPSSDYESTQDNAMHTRAALAAKLGAGVKLRITPRFYFDMRYEIIQTSQINTVDYSNTTFTGLDYDMGMKKINLNADNFRFGFVFDVSSTDYKKVVDEPAHWEETTQTLYLDPQDSTKVFVPCPCDNTKSSRRKTQNDPTIYEHRNDGTKHFPGNEGGIFTPGSGSGSGKGDFPGLKKPPVSW